MVVAEVLVISWYSFNQQDNLYIYHVCNDCKIVRLAITRYYTSKNIFNHHQVN